MLCLISVCEELLVHPAVTLLLWVFWMSPTFHLTKFVDSAALFLSLMSCKWKKSGRSVSPPVSRSVPSVLLLIEKLCALAWIRFQNCHGFPFEQMISWRYLSLVNQHCLQYLVWFSCISNLDVDLIKDCKEDTPNFIGLFNSLDVDCIFIAFLLGISEFEVSNFFSTL